MAAFLSWNDWISLRESNARKRAVKASLLGTGPELPGSYAACPSTNFLAMDVAADTGKVSKLPKSKWRKYKESNHIARPDYSIDRWLASAKELGDDVNSLVGHAKDDEEKIDKEKKEKEKETEPVKTSKVKVSKFEPKSEEEKVAWKTFKDLHKERAKDDSKEKKPDKKPVSKKPDNKDPIDK